MPNKTIKTVLELDGEAKLKTAIKNINKEFSVLGSETALITSKFDKNTTATDKLAAANNALASKIDLQKSKVDALRTALAESENATNRNESKTRDYQIQLNYAESALNNMNRQLDDGIEKLKKQENQFTKLSTTLTGVSEKSKKLGADLTSVGTSLSIGLTAPIIAAGTAALAMGMNFEAAMSRVKAISGATADEFKGLNELALQLGADTAFSAKEAAQGMENLASAGFSVNEITAAMPGMLDLAASGGLDVALAADIASSALRGFNIDASQSGHVADVLAQVAAATNASVTDMGDALKYAAPPANALGLSIEEVSAAIGLMANSGIKGAQAGTTLRGSLISLASPSKEAAGLMSKLAFNAFDAEGKMLPLKDVVDRLNKSTAKLTDQKKADAIATLFGKEALSGMMVVLDAGPEKLDSLTKSFIKSDGAAKNMAATMLDNTKGSIDAMMGSIETAGISLSKSFAPTVIKAAEKITELANAFAELSPETQKTITVIAAVAAAIGPAVVITGTLISSVGTLTAALATATAAAGAAGVTIELLAGPIGWVALAITAAAAAFVIYKNDAEDATKINDKLIKSFDKSAQTFVDQEKSVKENGKLVDELSEQLTTLAVKEKKTNGEKSKMAELVAQLNKLMPELNLAIDEQTGKLNQSKAAIESIIESKKKELMFRVYEDRLLELYKERAATTENMVTAQTRLTTATTAFGDALNGGTLAAMDNAKSEMEDAQINVDNLTSSFNANKFAIESVEASYDSLASGVIDSNGKAVESEAKKTTMTAELQAQQIANSEETAKKLEELSKTHYDQMGSIEDNGIAKTKLTAEEVKRNLENQIIDFTNWRAAIKELSAKVPTDVLTDLQALGPGAVPIINDLNTMSATELDKWVLTWREKSTLATSAAKEELGIMPSEAEIIGQQAGQGFADGLDKKLDIIRAAAKRVAKTAKEEMMEELDINSPSKVTAEIGGFAGEGFGLGLLDKLKFVTDAAAKLAAAALPDIDSKYNNALFAQSSLASKDATSNSTVSVNIDYGKLAEAVAQQQVVIDGRAFGRFVKGYA